MKNKPILRKIFNSIQVLLLIAALILMVTSTYGQYSQYEYKWIRYQDAVYKVSDAGEYQYAEPVATGVLTFSSLLGGNPVWGYLSLGIVGLCILISLASIIRKSNDRDSILHFILPVLAVPVYAFFAGMALEAADCLDPELFTVVTGANPLKTVTLLLCAVIILAFVKRSKLFNPKPVLAVELTGVSAQAVAASADELKKYKELLDSGVISQEEFDAKKKQILGL